MKVVRNTGTSQNASLLPGEKVRMRVSVDTNFPF